MEEEKTYICGFDVKYYNDGSCRSWTVPVTFKDTPKTQEDINRFLYEANQKDNDYILLDLYMICDKNLKIVYKNETMTAEDIAIAFEIIEECGLEISEVE